MKIRSCSAFAFIILVILVLVASCCVTQASAQTATPTPTDTPTPTPDVVDEIEIDGEYFLIERSISYGEIAVVIATMAILLPLLIYFTFKIITHYLR